MKFKNKINSSKSQGGIEYIVIIATVLIIGAVTTVLITGALGPRQEDVLFEQCKRAASQCATSRDADPQVPCEFCEEACVGPQGEPVFPGAIDCCKLGMEDEIYTGAEAEACQPSIKADFSYEPTNPWPEEDITFTDKSVMDPYHPDYELEVIDYQWSLGDGEVDSAETIIHSYDDPGTYTVELTITGYAEHTESPEMTTEEETDTYTEEIIVQKFETYTFNADIEGQGAVEIDPEQDEYKVGTEIKLEAAPNSDYYFIEWRDGKGSADACEAQDHTCEFEITADSSVTAFFRDYF